MKQSFLLHFFYFLFALLFLSCTGQKDEQASDVPIENTFPKQIHHPIFQTILDSAQLEGSILVYDAEATIFYSNDFDWAKQGRLPASTFKIPYSIIALETGVVESDSTIFEWDGADRYLDVWEQDLTFKEALRFSCVPCYQEVAREIGVDSMKVYLQKLSYGNMVLDSSSIDLFWLQGDSKISQVQQIDFLSRFYHSELPISVKTERTVKSMMLLEETESYQLSGKTGWAIRDGNNNGWFVGYVEKGEAVYFFAINVSPKQEFDMSLFAKIRIEVTEKALKAMGILSR